MRDRLCTEGSRYHVFYFLLLQLQVGWTEADGMAEWHGWIEGGGATECADWTEGMPEWVARIEGGGMAEWVGQIWGDNTT